MKNSIYMMDNYTCEQTKSLDIDRRTLSIILNSVSRSIHWEKQRRSNPSGNYNTVPTNTPQVTPSRVNQPPQNTGQTSPYRPNENSPHGGYNQQGNQGFNNPPQYGYNQQQGGGVQQILQSCNIPQETIAKILRAGITMDNLRNMGEKDWGFYEIPPFRANEIKNKACNQ